MSDRPVVIVADPPWKFGDRLPGKSRGASKHYACIGQVDEIADVIRSAAPVSGANVVLFLWRVSAMQTEALAVCNALGCVVKTELVWQKLTSGGLKWFGMGRYVRASHETCLIAVRGKAFPEIKNVRSTFGAEAREHSAKPEEFYSIVEAMYPSSEKHEVFARRLRVGWVQTGNELGSLGDAT